jgi:hypothetical protein
MLEIKTEKGGQMNEFELWLVEYEKTDPEPWPMRSVENKYMHMTQDQKLKAWPGGIGFHGDDVWNHICWSERMTGAWKRNLKNKFALI